MTFTMWSFGHFIFIISPFLIWLILYVGFKEKSFEEKRRIGVFISILGVLILMLRNIEIFINKNFIFHYEIIPLQICHFANFVLLYAFLKNHKTMFAFAWLFNLPAAYMSIIFANGLENYDSLLTLRGIGYIAGHMLIVGLTFWSFSSGFVLLNKKILVKLFSILIPLYLLAHMVNNLFSILIDSNSNYFYTMRPEAGTPLELFFSLGKTYQIGLFVINPIYLFLTAIFGFIIILIIYLLSYKIQSPKSINNFSNVM